MKLLAFSCVLGTCFLSLTSTTSAATLLHRYSFISNADDSIGAAHGVLMNGATISGGALALNGVGAYLDLPNGLVSTLTNATFETWITDWGSGTWSRIFDFGNSSAGEDNSGTGTEYLFLCPQTGNGNLRAVIKPPGGGEQFTEWAGIRLPLGTLTHVAWTLDASALWQRLYVDGSLVGEAPLTVTPADLGETVNNWLGRSQWNGDAYLSAEISEFRIYDGALTSEEVQQSYLLGPEVSANDGPVTITAQPQNQSVTELDPATFTVDYNGTRPVSFQWYRGTTQIPGATNQTYIIPSTAAGDHNVTFHVALTNQHNGTTYGTLSSNAVLLVSADLVKPQLLGAVSLYPTGVLVQFSEGLQPASGTNTANYSITRPGGSLAVTAATFGVNPSEIVLTTPTQSLSTVYTLSVTGVRDRSAAANEIAPGSQATFAAVPYLQEDIGAPAVSGSLNAAEGGYEIVGGGSGIGGTSDQFSFNYRSYSGDFDVQIRLSSLEFSSTWARAGLMARDGLNTNARFAASLAAPGPAGCYFGTRSTVGGIATLSGSFPASYPNAWLRLRRTGDLFEGLASADGQSWHRLSSATIAMSTTLQVGLAVTAGDVAGSTTAQFRDDGEGSGPVLASIPLPFEPMGPSTRRTPIAISEIMYKPANRTDGRNTEFIELYNSNPWPEDIAGYRLSSEVDYVFPPGTKIPGQGYVVVAANPADMQAVYGLTTVYGPYTNSLKTSGTLRLRDEQDSILLDLEYDQDSPWPMGADGTGHSIVLARPSYGENDPRAWARGELAGGSPGAAEAWQAGPLRNVVLNEVLAHTDLPQLDAVELYNHSNVPVLIGGCTLSDEASTNKFTIPAGMTIAARGHIAFTEIDLGFRLDASEETIYFKNPDGTQVLDAVRFEAQENGVSFGRYPDGANEWYRLSQLTLEAKNAAPLVSMVGFNEIMYHPLYAGDDGQYVELYNRGQSAVNLGGWKIGGGIKYAFPSNAVLAANSYLVVGSKLSTLLTNYPQLNATNAYGNFSGKLSGKGERLTLSMPDTITSTNSLGVVSTNHIDIVVDEVTYGTGGRWGRWSDGGGSSLELIDPRSDKRLASSWADSDETAKAPWTTVETTGVLNNGFGSFSPVQIGLLEAGECLIDNVEVLTSGGANTAGNGNFELGMNSLEFVGDHVRSSLDPNAGFGGSTALHVRASDSIGTGPNSIQLGLSGGTFSVSQTATLRYKARWLRGCPEPLVRFWGCYLEATTNLPVPLNLGTPGLPNSQARSNAAPAIYSVRHDPAVPAANEPVVVTARAADPDGLASLTLRYRVDPSTSTTDLPMNDNGSGGDAIAGDGIYSATLPGLATGGIAFVVLASDTKGASSRFPALLADNGPVRECVVWFGEPEPPNLFGTYHLWLTQTNVNRWNALPKMSNEDIDGTLVYNGRVIYNMGGRYSGSPWHQNYDGPAGNRAAHYVWSMPKDDLLLGYSSFNKIHWPGNDIQNDTVTSILNDSTLQREQAAYTFLRGVGEPWLNRRFVAVYVNGTRRGKLMEDACRPTAGNVHEQYFSDDDDGQFFKMQRWYEGSTTTLRSESYLQDYTTTGGQKKAARYRPVWALKDSPGSLSDFTNLYALITAANAYSQPDYENFIENVVDVENWMRVSAANHAAGNWDMVGSTTGQNADAWVSANHRWIIFTIDLSICLDNNLSGVGLFSFSDTAWQRMFATPKFGRMYYRALNELVNGPMQAAVINPMMDAKYSAFLAAGLSVSSPAGTKSWIANQRNSIISQLSSVNSTAFSVGSSSYFTANNSVTITGSAPVDVLSISINGVNYTPRWTSVTGWNVTVPVGNGTFNWTVAARDRNGNPVGGSFPITVQNVGTPASPVGNVVINEIMFNAPVPDAEYVELFNRSTSTAFDLSGWNFNGIDFTFPAGTVLQPQSYLVLAKSSVVFAANYGAKIPVFGTFDGNLQSGGETLSLIKPGPVPAQDVVVDRVRYEATAPWPTTLLTEPGVSLQLRDAAQDNSRVGNWSATFSDTPPPPPPPALSLLSLAGTWSYMQTENLDGENWIAPGYDDSGWPTGAGLLAFENNVGLSPLINTVLNDPRVPVGTVSAGHAYYFRTRLVLTNNLTGYEIAASAHVDDGAVLYVNGQEVSPRIRMDPGPVSNSTFANNLPPGDDATSPDTFTIPASMFQMGTNVIAVEVHQRNASSSDIVFGLALNATSTNQTPVSGGSIATPGYVNSGATNLPAFPTVWLNEIQAENSNGITDNFGERDPWVELHNNGSSAVDLSGLYLATNYSSLTQWAFPSLTLQPGQFLVVWLDGQTQQTSGTNVHASFRAPAGSGSLALSRLVAGQPEVVDYLNYSTLPANRSYGDFPDGQPFYREQMVLASPRQPNSLAMPPITIYINEWLADNELTEADPADGGFEDWFELYNPGQAGVDLGGYYLTDDLTNKFQFQVPANGHYIVPAGGFLLVWADNETGQNNTNRADLHVPFALSKGGEALGIFAPDGTQIDAVIFGQQETDVSQGRYPDGTGPIYSMTEPTPRLPNSVSSQPGAPQFESISVQGGTVSFSLSVTPGRQYRIEYKTDLSATSWLPLMGDTVLTNSPVLIQDSVGTNRQKFYRVIKLD